MSKFQEKETFTEPVTEPFQVEWGKSSTNEPQPDMTLAKITKDEIKKDDDKPLDGVQLCSIILACLLPPLGVYFATGFGSDLWLNCFLTLLFYLPGLIHAIYVILRKYKSEQNSKPNDNNDNNNNDNNSSSNNNNSNDNKIVESSTTSTGPDLSIVKQT